MTESSRNLFSELLEALSHKDKQAIEIDHDDNLALWLNDLKALNINEVTAVIQTMCGFSATIPPKDYMSVYEKGWRFPDDFDLNNPDEYGWDVEGNPLMGHRAHSPHGLSSVSIKSVIVEIRQSELLKDLFKKLTG